MIEFSEEKTKRLIERAKKLQEEEGYNYLQLSRTFGLEKAWFEKYLGPQDAPKDEEVTFKLFKKGKIKK